MKKIILILLLIYISVSSYSQKYFEHKSTNIKLIGITFCTAGTVNWMLVVPKNYVDSAVAMFPECNGKLQYKDSVFIYKSTILMQTINDIVSNIEVEQSDVGLKGNLLMQNFSLYLLIYNNEWKLNLNDWEEK